MNKQRQRKKRGTDWEATIAAENEGLRLNKRARIVRAYDALRVVGTLPNGKPKVVRVSKSEPDFNGLCMGGRSVSFDAKRTKTHRLSFPDPRKPEVGWWHQVEALTEVTAFGGIGFFYVLRDDLDNPFNCERFVLPVRNLRIAELDPRIDRSIDLRRADRYQVRGNCTWFDTVAANLLWWER